MPRASALKCYFGCPNNGPLHTFPKPEYPHLERFREWKNVLGDSTLLRPDSYIYYNTRICNNHFEWYYRSSSNRLTHNAIPTLNIESSTLTVDVAITSDPKEHRPCTSESSAITSDQQQHHGPCNPEPLSLTAEIAPEDQTILQNKILHSDVTQEVEHQDVSCDSCKEKVYGFRYKCVECADCDLCPACEARGEHPDHYVLRIPQPLLFRKAQALVDHIRNSMAKEGLFQKKDVPQPFNIREIDSKELDLMKVEPIEEFELNKWEDQLIDSDVNAIIGVKTDLINATDVECSNVEDEAIAIDAISLQSCCTPEVIDEKNRIKRKYSYSFTKVSNNRDNNINLKKARTEDINDPLDIR